MLAIPPSFLDQLHLQVGESVGIVIDNGRLIIESTRPQYTMAELLAASDYSQQQSVEEREWVDTPAVGKELI